MVISVGLVLCFVHHSRMKCTCLRAFLLFIRILHLKAQKLTLFDSLSLLYCNGDLVKQLTIICLNIKIHLFLN